MAESEFTTKIRISRKLLAAPLLIALLSLAACGQSAPRYGEAQTTVEAGGASVAMTLTAAVAQQSAAQANVAQVAPTATAWAQQTAYAQNATMQAATAAAQQTAQVQTRTAYETEIARTLAVENLTGTAQAVAGNATATTAALDLQSQAQNTTATWDAATATVEWEQEERARYRAVEDAERLAEAAAPMALAIILLVAAALVVVVGARALWRLATRPWVLRREVNEPLPAIIAQDARLTVHQLDRQVYPTAQLTDTPDSPTLPAQVQVTSQAQAAELARATPALRAGACVPQSQPRQEIRRMMQQAQQAAPPMLPERNVQIIEVEPGRVRNWLLDVEDQMLLGTGMEDER